MSAVADQAVDSPARPPKPAAGRLVWLDAIKGLAILGVLAHHFVAPATAFKLKISTEGFPGGLDLIQSLAHANSRNPIDFIFLILAGLGYQGVHVFLVASGFALAVADATRPQQVKFRAFLGKIVQRLLYPYWVFVVFLALIGGVEHVIHMYPGWLIGSSKQDFIINFFLLRTLKQDWLWVYPGALWFVPLIVQLYLIYPLLGGAMRKRPTITLIACLALTLAFRGFAVLFLSAAPIGVNVSGPQTPLTFFLARLFEFGLGVWFGQYFATHTVRLSRGPLFGLLAAGLAVWGLGIFSICYKPGLIVCEPLIGLGLSMAMFAIAQGIEELTWVQKPIVFLGTRTYSLFLTHSMLIPTALSLQPGQSCMLHFPIYVVAACLLAYVFDLGLEGLKTLWTALRSRRDTGGPKRESA